MKRKNHGPMAILLLSMCPIICAFWPQRLRAEGFEPSFGDLQSADGTGATALLGVQMESEEERSPLGTISPQIERVVARDRFLGIHFNQGSLMKAARDEARSLADIEALHDAAPPWVKTSILMHGLELCETLKDIELLSATFVLRGEAAKRVWKRAWSLGRRRPGHDEMLIQEDYATLRRIRQNLVKRAAR